MAAPLRPAVRTVSMIQQTPASQCPKCQSSEKQPINVSYLYKPDKNFERELQSTTYTLRCAGCGYIYTVSEPKK